MHYVNICDCFCILIPRVIHNDILIWHNIINQSTDTNSQPYTYTWLHVHPCVPFNNVLSWETACYGAGDKSWWVSVSEGREWKFFQESRSLVLKRGSCKRHIPPPPGPTSQIQGRPLFVLIGFYKMTLYPRSGYFCLPPNSAGLFLNIEPRFQGIL